MQVYGVYEKTLSRNEYSASTFFTFIELKNGISVAVHKMSGVIPALKYGTPLLIDAEPGSNGIMKAVTVTPYCSETETAKIFLRHAVSGLGEKTAEYITGITGPNVYESLERAETRDRLKSGKGIRTQLVLKVIRKVCELTKALRFIEKYRDSGISYPSVIRMLRSYDDAESALKSDPYSAGLKCGIRFQTIDSIAAADDFDIVRIRGLISYSLKHAESEGNTKVSIPTLLKKIRNLNMDCDGRDNIPPSLALQEMLRMKDIVIREEGGMHYVGMKDLFIAEQTSSFYVHRLLSQREEVDCDIAPVVEEFEEENGIRYSENQKKCFQAALDGGISIVTGGPGTGKTTVMKGLIRILEDTRPGCGILLCAPTGRAAKRLSESTGMEALTVHKALDFRKINDVITHRGENDPLTEKIVIVDEASMLDSQMFCILLSALRTGSTLILVGDPDQLPSVGAGNVLYDLIGSGIVPVYTLDTNFRQAAGSQIVRCASDVRHGKVPESKGDVTIEYMKDDAMTGEAVIHEAEKMISGNTFGSCQILCSTKQGPAGTFELNTKIQGMMNFTDKGVEYGRTRYHIGDRIIMTANCYESDYEYHNGDMGVITWNAEDYLQIKFLDREAKIPKEKMEDMMLAYAITIHKSQGSEFENILVSLPEKPGVLLNRKLLYTAVTRAKKTAKIISGNSSVYKSVMKPERKRETWLPGLL